MFVYIKLFLTAVFWGGTFIAGRVVAKDIGPFAASFLRFAIASVFLLFITLKTEGKFPILKKGQIIPVILLGMTGVFAYNVFFFKGLKIIEAGRASLIIANNPIFITLFASYFFKEKLNPIKVTGIIISVIGAIIVISRGNFIELLNGNVGWGEFYIFCCVLTWVAYTLIGKAIMTDLSPLVSVSYSSVVGAVALFVPAYFEGMMRDLVHYSTADWFGIFYLGFFGTVLGFVWYYQGIKIIGPMKASQFINFVPISAVLLAFFMLGESITLSLLVGTIFVMSGVYLTNTVPLARKKN
ncbi:MAG: DMT family transporter [Desulfobacteraceae bacterium]|nr:MAG: DMT family transporter [Desulfobacteraceae bacterium]